jgi:hypothetical protein
LSPQLAQRLEDQEKQDADLNDLVESLARMTPSIAAVNGLANANLAETVIAMLNLIEDASLFILKYKSRSSWGAWDLADAKSQADNLCTIQHEQCIL